MNRQIGAHDQFGQRNRMGGAAHVFLHETHIIAGLEIEPARVERDAFADNTDLRVRFVAPAELHDAWRFRARAADRVHHWIILF